MAYKIKDLENKLQYLKYSLENVELLEKAEDKPKRSRQQEWQEPPVSDPEKAKGIAEMVNAGYSPEEAHWHHGTQTYPRNIEHAMASNVKPTPISDKFFDDHKEMIGNWLDNAEKIRNMNAEEHKNPLIYAKEKVRQNHAEHNDQYGKDFKEFKDSIDHLSGMERRDAIHEWKNNWHGENPEHAETSKDLAKLHATYKNSKQKAQEHFDDVSSFLLGEPMKGAEDSASDEYSAQEAVQHLGGVSDEDSAPSISTGKDLLHQLKNNKKLVDALGQDRADRLKRIEAIRRAKGLNQAAEQAEPAKQPEEPKDDKPKTVIRRRPK